MPEWPELPKRKDFFPVNAAQLPNTPAPKMVNRFVKSLVKKVKRLKR